ncbi:hypothetical protein [Nonomuraea jiangxiensis]|uniref:Uncharacterized protein n=1 Tax=Nonomuraea jiangxiensis TaxID=633440 RepID=A0A1G9E1Q8_9ACTN|nr:hypothetical protein [Nonomuraea jiangxiensis]SDK70035.1 hypothetical protein SAMN05421869_11811 [Nonomuraea jiangxiensis]
MSQEVKQSIVRRRTWRSLQRRNYSLLSKMLDECFNDNLRRMTLDTRAFLLKAISSPQAARMFLDRLPDVLVRCNEDIYDLPLAAEAYAYVHLVDRYCRWWQVFLLLLQGGRFPIRRSGIHALDVGAGPGPATYALMDFGRAINEIALLFPRGHEIGQLYAPPPTVELAEASPAMSSFVHQLSEERGRGGPYGASIRDFYGLRILRSKHENAQYKEQLIRGILDQDEISYEWAARLLQEENPGWHLPERYHLGMVGNFLTTPDSMAESREALSHIKQVLPPGGMVLVMGGRGRLYPMIYAELEEVMSGLRHAWRNREMCTQLTPPQLIFTKGYICSIKAHLQSFGIDVHGISQEWPSNIRDAYHRWWNPNAPFVQQKFSVQLFRRPDGHAVKIDRRKR